MAARVSAGPSAPPAPACGARSHETLQLGAVGALPAQPLGRKLIVGEGGPGRARPAAAFQTRAGERHPRQGPATGGCLVAATPTRAATPRLRTLKVRRAILKMHYTVPGIKRLLPALYPLVVTDQSITH